MLEIFVLIALCRRIKQIVQPKGYSARKWQFYTVLTWVTCEITGFLISLMLGKDMFIVVLTAMLCAVGGFLLLQHKARRLPDLKVEDQEWIEEIGKADQQNQ